MPANKVILKFYFVFILLAAVIICMPGCKDHDPGKEKPNIVLILADDMGSGVPGCYGGTTIYTPNIDSLARSGMLFTNAYAGCSVCAPSRASMMTGMHTGHVSVRGNTGGIALPDRDTTLAEILKMAGYEVGGFGKWGLGDVGTEGVPEKHGFDVFFGYYHQIHAHFYYTNYLWRNSNKVEMMNNPGDSTSYSHYRIMKEMEQFITDNRLTPFFCYGSWTLPHNDDDGYPQIPETDPAYLLYKDKSWPENVKKYAAMNTRVDSDLGEILKLLRKLNIEKNTIIIFSSDNGGENFIDSLFHVNGKLRGYKHQFYEGGIRTPLIFSWPGHIEGGTKCDLPCYFADLMPTILEIAGARDKILENTDGFSLVPSLTGTGIQYKHDYLYWELPAFDWSRNVYEENGLQQAILVNDWKLLRHDSSGPWELFNLASDPEEQNNIEEQNPEIVEKLVGLIKLHRTEMPEQIEPEMQEGRWYR